MRNPIEKLFHDVADLSGEARTKYFEDNAERIEKWFNVIGPPRGTMKALKAELSQLRKKNWTTVHSL